jgi:xanthine/uracil permease
MCLIRASHLTSISGGSGACATNHTLVCGSGPSAHPWGSAQYLGLGFSCFAVIIICEIFGSAFMKSASVFLGLVTGLIIAACTGYFNSSVIKAAPGATFLWTHTFKYSLRGQLVLPMIAAWTVIVAEVSPLIDP